LKTVAWREELQSTGGRALAGGWGRREMFRCDGRNDDEEAQLKDAKHALALTQALARPPFPLFAALDLRS